MAPSLLAADFSRLSEEIAAVEAAGADLLHLDIMDGQFVDNITMGPVVLRGIRKLTSLFLDTHLMVSEPQRYVPAFRKAGADGITVHVEASREPAAAIEAVRQSGATVGLALNPDTPLSACEPYLGNIDLLLLMTVHPGFGGQAFRGDVVPKLEAAARLRRAHGWRFALEVDGGIDPGTARRVLQSGAEVLVAGTAIFHKPPYEGSIKALRVAAL